jgi:hypothetical protein
LTYIWPIAPGESEPAAGDPDSQEGRVYGYCMDPGNCENCVIDIIEPKTCKAGFEQKKECFDKNGAAVRQNMVEIQGYCNIILKETPKCALELECKLDGKETKWVRKDNKSIFDLSSLKSENIEKLITTECTI